jgi:hypothetical protein
MGECEAEFLLWEEVRSNSMLLARVKLPRVSKAPFNTRWLPEAETNPDFGSCLI